MCGIFAVLSPEGGIDAHLVDRATALLAHRGPDGRRHWVDPRGRVGLGHARLSIIDLVTGDQPIASENERLRLVANGEFYDYERITRELTERGHRFRTRSDSEIALHLYEDLGTSCLAQLRGEFAFVLWDEANDLLIAARDRFGIKPLYYAQHEGRLLLASEIKSLLAAGVPAAWDLESAFQYHHVYFDQDRTLFAGVKQVPPGHVLIAGRGHVQLLKYWDFDFPRLDARLPERSDVEYIDEFRQMLTESVRLRLRADVPVGCYLSGGIDSCALLGLAAEQHPLPIEAFTLCFDTEGYNEQSVAEEMAAHAGAHFHPFPITQTLLADNLSDAVWHAETMTANPHGVAKFLLSRMVRDHGFKVVLTGEGSDEMLGGYPHFRRDVLLHSSPELSAEERERQLEALTESNEVSRGILLPAGEKQTLDSVQRILGSVPTWMETRASNSARYRNFFHRDFAAAFADRDPYLVFLDRVDVRGQLADREALHQAQYLWARSMFPNYLLNFLGDRMEMAHSIEGRVPFLDHVLVERVRDMPVRMKVRGSREKYVLREATKHVLTRTVYERQKHPFIAPPAGLELEGRLMQRIIDTLRSRTLDDLPFYDADAVRSLVDLLPHMPPDRRATVSYLLTMVTSACLLRERYKM